MSHPASREESERLRIHRRTAAVADDFAADVRRGLTAERKFLLPKYFYDALGSRLFDAICLVPDYYLTRAEADIFERHAAEIVESARDGARRVTLFELGSGSASKTRRIIAARPRLHYVPVDISTAALEESASALLGDYDGLSVTAYAADYDTALPRLRENFEEGACACLLPGADLKKEAATLEAAYDDPVGVTAAFNLNLLARINRELAADFR